MEGVNVTAEPGATEALGETVMFVITGGGPAPATMKLNVAVSKLPLRLSCSQQVTTVENVPSVVGVPLNFPLEPLLIRFTPGQTGFGLADQPAGTYPPL